MRREVLDPPAGLDTRWRDQRDRELAENLLFNKIHNERLWAERRRLSKSTVRSK